MKIDTSPEESENLKSGIYEWSTSVPPGPRHGRVSLKMCEWLNKSSSHSFNQWPKIYQNPTQIVWFSFISCRYSNHQRCNSSTKD